MILSTLSYVSSMAFANHKNMIAVETNIIEVSQELLLAAKTKEPTDSLVNIVRSITETMLTNQLKNDDSKKAFWINIYNAYTQISLHAHPDKYKNRGSFFGEKQIDIAGKNLSLDDVEHGLLRRSKIKWSLGHLNKLFPSSFEKQQRVDTLDYRIHFALNCGAASCPPIAFYKPEQISKQLDLATKAYLQGDAVYKEKENEVALPAIMGWFRGDFGGKKKMLSLLRQLKIIPERAQPKIKFSKYNWDLFLENYKQE
ncbi:MAG: DUF547 domain-containing protein [Chitinophagaceae bacterium]|nr:DUF547 domain-containing protein [Chitinophagaceae bacterium]